MKKYILYIAFIIVVSCKKEDQPPVNNNPTSPMVQKDSRLLGVWSQDSSQADGGGVVTGAGSYFDSIFVSNSQYVSKSYYLTTEILNQSFTWETTAADSLFLELNGVESNHYKYSFNGNVLLLYLNSTAAVGYDVKYWYHKVQ